jgi:uncharacterized protein (DUF3084 family)
VSVESEDARSCSGRGTTLTKTNRLTIQQAARRLGVKEDAIRKRVKRGSLEHDKDPDGRVYVYLDATYDDAKQRQDVAYPVASQEVLVEALSDQVEYLRRVIETRDRELEARTEEIRRRDIIISSLAQRIPELPAAPSANETAPTDRSNPPEVAVPTRTSIGASHYLASATGSLTSAGRGGGRLFFWPLQMLRRVLERKGL